MKKVKIPTNEGIDWSKQQWVISEYGKEVVLTTGQHKDGTFTGTCMPCNEYPKGNISTFWMKSCFKPLTFDIPFTISNSNNED